MNTGEEWSLQWWMIKPTGGGQVHLWRLPPQEGGEGSLHQRIQALEVELELFLALLAQVVVWVVGTVVVRVRAVVRAAGESPRGQAVCWQQAGGAPAAG